MGIEAFSGIDGVDDLVQDMITLGEAVVEYSRDRSKKVNFSVLRLKEMREFCSETRKTIDDAIYFFKKDPILFSRKYAFLISSNLDLAKKTPQETLEALVISSDDFSKIEYFILWLSSQQEIFVDFASTYGRSGAKMQQVRVNPGDTLRSISREWNVPESDIIEANNLQWPYLANELRPSTQASFAEKQIRMLEEKNRALASNERSDLSQDNSLASDSKYITYKNEQAAYRSKLEYKNIAYIGDVLRIPVNLNPRETISVIGIKENFSGLQNDSKTIEEQLFGRDFFVDQEGNLKWDDDAQQFATIAAIENINYAQMRYIKLRIGSLVHAPSIGSYLYEVYNKWAGARNTRMVAYSLWKTLSQDPRVVAVKSVVAEYFGGKANVTYNLELINGFSIKNVRTPIG